MSSDERGNDFEILVDVLPLFKSGNLTVTVNKVPLLKADAEAKSLDIEFRGTKEAGLNLQSLVKIESKSQGILGTLKSSQSMAKGLSDKGWKLSVYDGRSNLLTMGKGVSALTGHIRANPLKLLKALSIS